MISSKDLLFGKIAIRRRYVSKKEIRECLRIQREQGVARPLAQILLEKGRLDFDQIEDILSVARKAQKGTGQTQRTHVPLFGRLAIQKGYCSWNQINECLREQSSRQTSDGEGPRARQMLLGQLLIRKRFLSVEQFMEILRLQEKIYMVCGECGKSYNVAHYKEGRDLRCRDCGGPLERPPRPDEGEIQRLTPESVEYSELEPTRVNAAPAANPPPSTQAAPTPTGVPEAGPLGPSAVVGNYQIEERIAQGAMGVVYRARHRTLGRVVALKVLRNPAAKRGRSQVKRFQREGQAIAQLDHPGIVRIHDWGEESGVYYCAMDFLPGETMDKILAHRPPAQREGLRILAEVARAVQAAHEAGIVHRDLKPSNIMVGPTGDPIVMDFGLAKLIGEGEELTRSGEAMGTPYYMSPEQARGDHRRVDARSDVFSLGVMLYEVLTGRLPFKAGSSLEVYKKIQTEDPIPPRKIKAGIPEEVEAICLKALQKSPGDRYDAALDLAEDIDRHLSGSGVHARRTGMFRRMRRRVSRNVPLYGAISGIVLALGGGAAGIGLVHLRHQRELREEMERSFDLALAADRFEVALEILERLPSTGVSREELEPVRARARQFLEKAAEEAIRQPSAGARILRLAEMGPRFGVSRATVSEWKRGAVSAARAEVELLLAAGRYDEGAAAIRARQEALRAWEEFGDLVAWARGDGKLSLVVRPPGAEIAASLADPATGLFDKTVLLGQSPIEGAWIPQGLVRLRMTHAAHHTVEFPVLVRREADGHGSVIDLEIALDQVPKGMCYVPGGEVAFPDRPDPRPRYLPGFLIDAREVSVDRYFREFLTNMPDLERRARHAPTYRPDEAQAPWAPLLWTGLEPPADRLEYPMTHIDWESARAFAQATGTRLPTSDEWEKAARGIDGRPYPWGLAFDPRRCKSAGTAEEASMPAPMSWYLREDAGRSVGSSPYGCVNMSGNVQEWLYPDDLESPSTAPAAGGHFRDGPENVRAWARRQLDKDSRSVETGFRTCRSLLVPNRPGHEVEDLAGILTDRSRFFGLRQEAARLLGGHLSDVSVRAMLLEVALSDTHPEVRGQAVSSLVSIRDQLDQSTFLAALGGGDMDLRQRAFEALSSLANDSAVETLTELLRAPDYDTRRDAMNVLLRAAPPAGPPLYEKILADETVVMDGRLKAAHLAASSGRPDSEAKGMRLLLEASQTGEAADVFRAGYYLLFRGEPRGILPLLEGWYESSGKIEGADRDQLEWCVDQYMRLPGIEAQLLRGLEGRAVGTRVTSARILGSRRIQSAAPRLETLAKSDPSPEVQSAARQALKRIRGS